MDNKKIKIAVFGDAILDLFSYYTSPRQSPEASVPIITKQKEDYFAGGAALTATKLNETVEAASAISEYNEQISEGVKNMNALNSLYELQLQTSSQQMEASTQFLQNLSTSIEDSKRFQQEVGKLAENLSSLNEVYANMLNAMSPNK